MGNFYANYTLRGPSQQVVAEALAGRSAIVTPAQDGCVLVFDEESDDQNGEIIAELAARLSGRFNCPLLAVLNHDDDIFWYGLYLNGELADEYDSKPGYFETVDEDAAMAGPEGGDAERLCQAFGAKAVAKVRRILRPSSLSGDGYTFEVERHGDLMAALGLPSFGVGFGFRAISTGELPEEINAGDLVATKELPPAPPSVGDLPKPIPGYYKVSFRAHPQLTKSIPTGWMPNLWAEMDRPESTLSNALRQATAGHRERFRQLGYFEQGFKHQTRVLNPNFREGGGINFLDARRRYFGQLLYNRSFWPASQSEKETLVIAFTAVFPDEVFSCTNHMDFLEPVPGHHVIRLKSSDVDFIHAQFLEHLQKRPDSPRHFPDQASLQVWFDSNAFKIFEYRVHQGTWVRMSDFEVEKAKRQLQ
jgi:hypothetical protein